MQAMRDEYTELNLYFEDKEDGDTVDLWVYTEPGKFFIVNNVNGNPTRYQGWWTIPFIQYNRYASVHVEASNVMYFVTIEKDKVDATAN